MWQIGFVQEVNTVVKNYERDTLTVPFHMFIRVVSLFLSFFSYLDYL